MDGKLSILWSDGHTSIYCPTFLYERRFTETNQKAIASLQYKNEQLWNAKIMQDNVPTETFDNVSLSKYVNYFWGGDELVFEIGTFSICLYNYYVDV